MQFHPPPPPHPFKKKICQQICGINSSPNSCAHVVKYSPNPVCIKIFLRWEQGQITSWVYACMQSPICHRGSKKVCMISAKLLFDAKISPSLPLTASTRNLSLYHQEWMFCSSVMANGHELWLREQIFCVAWQMACSRNLNFLICSSPSCGHNWYLSENNVLCCVTCQKFIFFLSEWLIYLFHLWKQDVNWSNINKWKPVGDALSCRAVGQNLFPKKIFVTSVGDLKLNSKYCQQFKCLSWKIFCPVQVNSLLVQLHMQNIICHSTKLTCSFLLVIKQLCSHSLFSYSVLVFDL